MYLFFQCHSHTWKWFDDSSGRWCKYSAVNNKTIDDAYQSGETSIRLGHLYTTDKLRVHTVLYYMYFNEFGQMMNASRQAYVRIDKSAC